jgi:hypothetical protein
MSERGCYRARLAPILVGLFAVSIVGGCDLFSTCPTSVDAAGERGVPGQKESTFIAVARVVRFVPSPAVSSRGYDLDVRRVLLGGSAEPIQGLRVADPIESVDRGSAVLVLAEEMGALADETGGLPKVLIPGRCQPLQAISEAEFARWTGE